MTNFATRIAGFDKKALALTKRLVNERWAPPTDGELLQSFRAISDAITWPQAQARMHLLAGRGWGTDSDVELNHADLVGDLGPELARTNDGR